MFSFHPAVSSEGAISIFHRGLCSPDLRLSGGVEGWGRKEPVDGTLLPERAFLRAAPLGALCLPSFGALGLLRHLEARAGPGRQTESLSAVEKTP